jgi:hypothetical protein
MGVAEPWQCCQPLPLPLLATHPRVAAAAKAAALRRAPVAVLAIALTPYPDGLSGMTLAKAAPAVALNACCMHDAFR